MKRIRSVLQLLALALFLLGSARCGGGTSGTGLHTFSGEVRSVQAGPLAGATITVTSTGESAVTDSQGRFLLRSDVTGGNVEFAIHSGQFDGLFTVPNVSPDSAQVSVDIVIDPGHEIVLVTNFSLQVDVVGGCAPYFTNDDTIQQVSEVPKGSVCDLDVSLSGDGQLRGNIPIALQYNSCSESGVWRNLSESKTGTGSKLGRVRLAFKYTDSKRFCRYRVVAPYNYSNYHPVEYQIETLTEQELTSPKSAK